MNYFNIIKKFNNLVFVILIIVIIALCIYVVFNRLILKKPVVKIFGYSILQIVSGSMEPQINVGDIIIIKEQEKYREGDIITYREDKFLVTHRIVSVDEEKVITKGDNNNIEDSAIEISKIEGKVIYKLSK